MIVPFLNVTSASGLNALRVVNSTVWPLKSKVISLVIANPAASLNVTSAYKVIVSPAVAAWYAAWNEAYGVLPIPATTPAYGTLFTSWAFPQT